MKTGRNAVETENRSGMVIHFAMAVLAQFVVPVASAELVAGQTVSSDNAVVQPSDIAFVTNAASTVESVRELEEAIEQARATWGVPGMAVAIVKDGEVISSRGYGVKRMGEQETVDEHTVFAIASNSKAFTAAALAILVDEGKLDWDEPVSKFLPWLKLKDPLATADLRVRDLLCHRSGLGTFSGDLLWWGTSYSPREVLERMRYLNPAGPFRAHYGYSNLMFLAAGEVVREVSGMSWQEFVTTRILQPVGMSRSLTSTGQLGENAATPHKTEVDNSVPFEWVNWDTMAAAGGIISSSHDMGLWLQVQLRLGKLADGSQLFSAEQSHTMWHPHTIIPTSQSKDKSPVTNFQAYGLGWSLKDYKGVKLVGHGGGYDGMYSHVLMVPEHDLGVVVLTNSMTSLTSTLTYGIVNHFLADTPLDEFRQTSEKSFRDFKSARLRFNDRIAESTMAVSAGKGRQRPLSDYVGKFRCPLYGDATVQLEEGSLVLRLEPNPDLVADLEPLHYNTFRVTWRSDYAWFEGGNVHFVDNARGQFTRLELDIPNDDLWFYELDLRRVEE